MSESPVHASVGQTTLEDLSAYLAATGWRQIDTERRMVWQPTKQDYTHLQVSLPQAGDVDEISPLLEEAIQVVAFVEGRSVLEIAAGLTNGGADTLSVRLTPQAPAGSASLALAEASISALRRLIIGAATGLTSDVLVLPSRRPPQAERYAADAHVATRPGSFILDVALPLAMDLNDGPAQLGQETLIDLPPQPYGRGVTERIRQTAANALATAQRLVAGEASLDEFADPRRRLGNATELDALARLGGDGNGQYQLRLTESPLVATRAPVTVLRATTDQQVALAEAAEFLRRTQPQKGVVVEGFVVRLFRQGNFGPGEVTVNAVLDDTGLSKKCVMSLAETDYAIALHAHEEGLLVLATGDLEAVGNRKHLRNVTAFRISDNMVT